MYPFKLAKTFNFLEDNMNAREISQELRKIEKSMKEVESIVIPGIELSNVAKNSADAIDSLQAFTDFVNKLPQCNDCLNTTCGFRPPLGKPVRYNCPLYSGVLYNSDLN